MRYITVDGVEYKVNLKYASLGRSFSLHEGDHGGEVLTGRTKRDILGTDYGYELAIEQDPDNPQDYDLLYEVLSAPVESHIVTFPYGQTTLTYEAMITDGNDTYGGTYAGVELWNGLTIHFEPIEPQRTDSGRASSIVIVAHQLPRISLNPETGIVTAIHDTAAGFVVADTKTATYQLPVRESRYYSPGHDDVNIGSGIFLTGEHIISGDPNLISENIRNNVNIFGVVGSSVFSDEIVAMTSAEVTTAVTNGWAT